MMRADAFFLIGVLRTMFVRMCVCMRSGMSVKRVCVLVKNASFENPCTKKRRELKRDEKFNVSIIIFVSLYLYCLIHLPFNHKGSSVLFEFLLYSICYLSFISFFLRFGFDSIAFHFIHIEMYLSIFFHSSLFFFFSLSFCSLLST